MKRKVPFKKDGELREIGVWGTTEGKIAKGLQGRHKMPAESALGKRTKLKRKRQEEHLKEKGD